MSYNANLPDGVTDKMIPGNRPIDDEYRYIKRKLNREIDNLAADLELADVDDVIFCLGVIYDERR